LAFCHDHSDDTRTTAVTKLRRPPQEGPGDSVGAGEEVGSAVVVACGLGDAEGFAVGEAVASGGGGGTPRSFAMSVRMRWISAGVIHSA
jgi:hypothetical protein